eukprot:gene17252-22782_t
MSFLVTWHNKSYTNSNKPSIGATISTDNDVNDVRPHVAVIGAGWGGWGSAKALCELGCKVTLLDSSNDPIGAKPLLTPSGKPFEIGTRGFWMDYPNLYSLIKNELKLKESDVFTPCTQSSFYSPYGLEATAPVFSTSLFPDIPSPIGQIFASSALFTRLPVIDRMSIAGLLYAMLDFNRNEETFEYYDKMTANELFNRVGVTKRLADDFLNPTLLVGLFKSSEELSAAVTLELLYFYCLAHVTSFDVKWIRRKSINEVVINPLANYLSNKYDITILGDSFVESINVNDSKVSIIRYKKTNCDTSTDLKVDACILAVGSKGLRSILSKSQELAKSSIELCKASSLIGIDVISCRLWLDKKIKTKTPANVFSNFRGLRGSGGTFFMLDQLQASSDDSSERERDLQYLWGDDKPQGSVIACDFYNAGGLLALKDEDIVNTLINELLPGAVPEFKSAKVVDSYVLKSPQVVNWFSPGSFSKRPPSILKDPSNLAVAGDWVKLGFYEHGSKGLCQERAYVTGIEAANALARSGSLGVKRKYKRIEVLPVRQDEIQVKLGRDINKWIKGN